MGRIATITACLALFALAAGGPAQAQGGATLGVEPGRVGCCNIACVNGRGFCLGTDGNAPPNVSCPPLCTEICGAADSTCSSFASSGCPDGQNALDCVEGCQPVCPPTFTPTNTPTNTPTVTDTPTNTPTNTPVPQGGACTTPSQCSTGFCVADVCCDTACTSPQERCDLPGQRGTCTSTTAPAPAVGWWGLLAVAVFLASVGALTLRRRSVRR